MAIIGGGPQPNFGLQPAFHRPMGGPASAGAMGPAGPAGNLGYGRQVLGDVDLIMTLLSLLQQPGASAPGCENGGLSGIDGSALKTAGGKGGALKRAGGKGGGGRALQLAAGKGAPALRKAGGK